MMRRQLILTPEPISQSVMAGPCAENKSCGALLSFVGIVRSLEGDQVIEGIDYEAYQAMAKHQFQLLFNEMEQRWPIESVRLIHRLGRVDVGQASLWVELLAPHRQEAFEALGWLIDTMKQKVPIWKHPIPRPETATMAPRAAIEQDGETQCDDPSTIS